jgi:signal peptidase I
MRGSRKAIKELLQIAIVTVLIYVGVHATISPRIVDGQSMEPTLHNNEWVMLDKVSYMLHSPQRGDIIVFKYPQNPTQDYIKRVIGVAGDHVLVADGHVYVNGRQLSESYIADPPDYSQAQCSYCDVVVPKGYLYVLGDNRDNSSDSHVWGFVPLGNVVGRAMFAYWPMPDITLLH